MGTTLDSLVAEVLVRDLDIFERIERVIAITDSRRNSILRELDRHRSVFTAAPLDTVRQIEGRTLTSKPKRA